MEFVYKEPNPSFTNEEILRDVINVKEKIGKKTLTFNEYRSNGGLCGQKAINNHFGSWNKLLDVLGVEKTRISSHLSKEDIFNIIEKLWLEKGSQPTLSEFEKTHHTKKIIISNFGTWSTCLQQFVNWANSNHKKITIELNKMRHTTPREPNNKLKVQVFKRDGLKCAICGRTREKYPELEFEIDHKKPYSKGGETVLDNLQVLCRDCNSGKGNDIIE